MTLINDESRFRQILDRAPVMVWTARPDTTLDFLNGTCVDFTGMPLDQLLDEGWLNAVHPDDVDHCTGIYVPAVEARRPFQMEYRLRRADGAYRWVLDSGVPNFATDGSFLGYIGSSIDITERREAEERNRESRAALESSHHEIQRLADRLIEAQEAERARVARDLHDDISQQLATMSIAFSALKSRLDKSQVSVDFQAELESLNERAATVAQSVRELSHGLHPTMLGYAGLVTALTTYCTEIDRAHGIAVTCSAEGDFASVAPASALCLYRIAQEALRNVIAHAGARRVDVRLLRAGNVAEMTVIDDGKGFVSAPAERRKGLGLVSMSERARLAGGTLGIASTPGKGTRLTVCVPADARAEDAASRAGEGQVA